VYARERASRPQLTRGYNVQAGEDPYVRQAMAVLKEGESHKRFFDILDSIPEKKAAKGNAALIEAVGGGVGVRVRELASAART
jgi:hypothetical protein